MFDFLIEIKTMNEEIEIENKMHVEMQNDLKRLRYGR